MQWVVVFEEQLVAAAWPHPWNWATLRQKIRPSQNLKGKKNLRKESLQPWPPVAQVPCVCHRWTLHGAWERYRLQIPASLLEIAESGSLRGVGCRRWPVAGVSASHATAAVTPQSSHSCWTGPLCSHHLCGSEGRQAGDRGRKGQKEEG